ncbi:MAG: sigma-70 family RNA polymerase sigma factor [Spirochaetes bacterium]|jgi:RNA polymerase sigma-70 factor (ECF subfamily)|nr:sigma-70 family RNA polymerase sigma factor [Spirochaetota bacterium]
MPELNLLSDEDLVGLYKEGDEKAFNELYRRFAPRLKRLIYFYSSNADEVNDIFHESIIRVVKHIDGFDMSKAFSSWIYQIAVNCCKNQIKKNRRQNDLIEKEKFRIVDRNTDNDSPDMKLINDLEMKEFNTAVNGLKDKFKDVFLLRFDQKMMYSEISEILNCSERTAKWRMEKAVEIIARQLRDKGLV